MCVWFQTLLPAATHTHLAPVLMQAGSRQRAGVMSCLCRAPGFLSLFVSCFTNWWPMNQQKKHLLWTWWIVAFLGFISSPSSTSFTLSHIKFFSLYTSHVFFFFFLLKPLLIVLKTAFKKSTRWGRDKKRKKKSTRIYSSLWGAVPRALWSQGDCSTYFSSMQPQAVGGGLVSLEVQTLSKAWPSGKLPWVRRVEIKRYPEIKKGTYHTGQNACPLFDRNMYT